MVSNWRLVIGHPHNTGIWTFYHNGKTNVQRLGNFHIWFIFMSEHDHQEILGLLFFFKITILGTNRR